MSRTAAVVTLIVLFAVGFWLVKSLQGGGDSAPSAARQSPAPRPQKGADYIAGSTKLTEAKTRRQNIEAPAGAIPGEVILSFADDEAFEAFLRKIDGNPNLRLLGRIDRLRMLRIGLRGRFDLSSPIDPDQLSFNYTAVTPDPSPDNVQAGAVGFGDSLLSFLGIEGRSLDWGRGVRVAVIDSGIADHPTFRTGITRIDLRDAAALAGEVNGHGTAVASIIAGSHPLAPGIAPSADLISIAVTDSAGTTDSFTLAQAFLSAADAGADIINISMGTFGDSRVLQEAVNFVQGLGIVVVAPTGNDGVQQVAFPAAYRDVIAVGAVDANANHLNFSNIGPQVDIAAPGLELSAAWPGDQRIAFTGSSGAAPGVVGTMAAFASLNPHLTMEEVAGVVLGQADDTNFPGIDVFTGNGVVATDRVVGSTDPERTDLAVSGFYYDRSSSTLTTIFQNRGTTSANNVSARVTVNGGDQNFVIPFLGAGETYTLDQFVSPSLLERPEGLPANAAITPPATDARSDNDARGTQLQITPPSTD